MKTAYEGDKCCNKDSEKGHHAARKPVKMGYNKGAKCSNIGQKLSNMKGENK